ncbi:hypothetical protein KGF56_000493 [Candida oxycetoniae]|uniref:ribonuclease III n=1 Tax=Candida oxycetoniae TaxID=497107 RepID=A0AAI9T1E8_9ASCO|nr:uncharacterized protein KGF56_000493 [Candida oxycetoniae]KAI3406647.2 hypothetical protein KGF56_000493 [Candida oxycetoniae]
MSISEFNSFIRDVEGSSGENSKNTENVKNISNVESVTDISNVPVPSGVCDFYIPTKDDTTLCQKRQSQIMDEDDRGGCKKKFRVNDSRSSSAVSESIFDRPPPRSIGFLDLQRLEHATKSMQKSVALILNQAPSINELTYMINSPDIDSGTKSELQQSNLISLASKLKSKYMVGDAPILDSIFSGELVLSRENLEALTKVEGELDSKKVEVIFPRNTVDDVPPTGIKDNLPPLPIINDATLYEKVFVHKSTVNNKTYLGSENLIHCHNERLEFLGDSILNNLVTLIIFKRFPNNTEGDLSKIRAAMINNRVLKDLAVSYGFDRKLRTRIPEGSLTLGDQKIYADVFEAYIGALGLERGFDLDEIKSWLESLYDNLIIELQSEFIKDPLDRDAKTELYSKVGTADLHPDYKVVTVGDGSNVEYVVECSINGEFLGSGSAPSAKEASLRAAMNALKNTPVVEKYFLERKKTTKPIQLQRKERNEQKKLEKLKKLEEAAANLANEPSTPFTPPSPIHTEMFPVEVDYECKLDCDAKNKLYAKIGKETGTQPEYIIAATENNQHTAQLRIRNLNVAVATDTSRKKAMSRVANAIWNNKEALRELCKRFDPPKISRIEE